MGGKGSGGARLRSGPAPDPNALRRDRDAQGWIRLENHGVTPPDWPVEIQSPSMEELAMWNRLWREKPQAQVWLADHTHDVVALYVRIFLDSTKKAAPAVRATQAKQLADTLLLTTPALHAARYVILAPRGIDGLEDAMARHPAGKATTEPKRRGSARANLTVVELSGDDDEED